MGAIVAKLEIDRARASRLAFASSRSPKIANRARVALPIAPDAVGQYELTKRARTFGLLAFRTQSSAPGIGCVVAAGIWKNFLPGAPLLWRALLHPMQLACAMAAVARVDLQTVFRNFRHGTVVAFCCSTRQPNESGK